MKLIKIYILAGSLLLLIAISIGVYSWYTYQKLTVMLEENGIKLEDAREETTSTEQTPPPPYAISDDEILTGDASDDAVITVYVGDLTDTQRNMLEMAGFEGEYITITAEMRVCAENAVGRERLIEIQGGSMPGPLEMMQLYPCVN